MNRLPLVFFGVLLAASMQQVLAQPTKTATLSCPSSFSQATALPTGAKVLGATGATKLSLLNAGLVLGKIADVTNTVFNEEVLDEWTARADGTELTLAAYGQGHQDLMLRCTYQSGTGKSGAGKAGDGTSTTLLVPLPERPLECQMVRKADRTLSATCTVK